MFDCGRIPCCTPNQTAIAGNVHLSMLVVWEQFARYLFFHNQISPATPRPLIFCGVVVHRWNQNTNPTTSLWSGACLSGFCHFDQQKVSWVTFPLCSLLTANPVAIFYMGSRNGHNGSLTGKQQGYWLIDVYFPFFHIAAYWKCVTTQPCTERTKVNPLGPFQVVPLSKMELYF